MKISVIPVGQLTAEHIKAWHELQTGIYQHPFFSPEYAMLVADANPHARVAVMEQEDQYGFFPFQMDGRRTALPIGNRLTDFQGLIVPDRWQVDTSVLMRACKIDAWRFDHLVEDCTTLAPFVRSRAGSPWIDLSRGFQAYADRLKELGYSTIKQTERKLRKLEREVGPVRLELHDRNRKAYQRLIEWKTEYIRARGAFPLLQTPWVLCLLDQVQEIESEWMSGRLSVLYVGDRVAAVHLGVGSRRVFHWWITSYDVELQQYSPGAILLMMIARNLADLGVERLDLGKGDETYKQRWMTNEEVLGEGSVTRTLSQRWLERARQHYRATLKHSALSPLIQTTKRWVRYRLQG